MSLNLLKLPPLILTNNAAELVYEKIGILDADNTYAFISFTFNEGYAPDDGQTLVLLFGDESTLTFTFSSTPGDDANMLPSFTGGDFDAYGANLALNIYAHPYINERYTVDYLGFDDGGTGDIVIRIISRTPGASGEVIISTIDSTVPLDIIYGLSSVDRIPLNNYVLNGRVILRMGGDANLHDINVTNLQAVGKIDADTNTSKITFHDLPSVCKSYLGVDIPYDIYNVKNVEKSAGKLMLEISESYDTGLQIASDGTVTNDTVYKKIQFPTYTTKILCLAGGMPLKNFPYAESLNAWLTLGGEGGGYTSFLSLQPGRTKIIDINQPEWLSIVLPVTPFTLSLLFTIYYTDNSTSTESVDIPYGLGPVCSIPTGVPQYLFWASNNIAYYTVQVFTTFIGLTSELFTYVIDTRYFRDTRYFIYQNSLGQIDTLRCVGVNKFTIQRQQQISNRTLKSTDRSEKGSFEMVYNELEQVWTMRTGWLLSRDEKEFLIDFLSSTYVAEVVMPLLQPNRDGRDPLYYKQPYKSCLVIQDTIDMWQHDDFNWGLEWKMKYANPETNYSNIPALPEILWDTEIEFDYYPGASGGAISFTIPGAYVVEVNEVSYNAPPNWPVNAGGDPIHFKIKAQKPTYITIQGVGSAADAINIKKLIIPTVKILAIAAFYNFRDNYFCKRLPYLLGLQELIIYSYGDNAIQADKRLSACRELYNNAGAINTIDFSYYTPTAIGYAIKGALMDIGISVTTM